MSITISKDGKGYLLEAAQRIEQPIEETFAFFSTARNLERITPPTLRFEVLKLNPAEMQQGTLIDYRLRVHGIRLHWQSEITVWEPPYRFVDQQRKGPYRWWIHEHLFKDDCGSTIVRDRVRYGMPLGPIVNWLFVARDVKKIFKYRANKLAEIFLSAR